MLSASFVNNSREDFGNLTYIFRAYMYCGYCRLSRPSAVRGCIVVETM